MTFKHRTKKQVKNHTRFENNYEKLTLVADDSTSSKHAAHVTNFIGGSSGRARGGGHGSGQQDAHWDARDPSRRRGPDTM